MPRVPIEVTIKDFSQFSKNLSRAWPEEKPSHLSLLNLLAGAAGFQNFQHLKAMQEGKGSSLSPDEKRWNRLINDSGQVVRWPTKRKDQLAMLWLIASRLPKAPQWNQQQFDEWIKTQITFGDHVLVRRELVELNCMSRTVDGKSYWRNDFALPEMYQAYVAANGLGR